MAVSYAEIKHEFDVTLGYIHDDIRELCGGNKTLNYTVALLIGIACEALEDAGYQSKRDAMSDLLPDQDWKQLATVLYDALRNGLAHNFDTKHIHINGTVVQIYFVWHMPRAIAIEDRGGEETLSLGTVVLGRAMCHKINQFRTQLQNDSVARERFKKSLNSSGRHVKCAPELWDKLKKKP